MYKIKRSLYISFLLFLLSGLSFCLEVSRLTETTSPANELVKSNQLIPIVDATTEELSAYIVECPSNDNNSGVEQFYGQKVSGYSFYSKGKNNTCKKKKYKKKKKKKKKCKKKKKKKKNCKKKHKHNNDCGHVDPPDTGDDGYNDGDDSSDTDDGVEGSDDSSDNGSDDDQGSDDADNNDNNDNSDDDSLDPIDNNPDTNVCVQVCHRTGVENFSENMIITLEALNIHLSQYHSNSLDDDYLGACKVTNPDDGVEGSTTDPDNTDGVEGSTADPDNPDGVEGSTADPDNPDGVEGSSPGDDPVDDSLDPKPVDSCRWCEENSDRDGDCNGVDDFSGKMIY